MVRKSILKKERKGFSLAGRKIFKWK